MKLKVTNKFGQPYGINPVEGSRVLKHGESYEGEFSEGEARNINGNTNVFAVEGYVEPAPGQSATAAQDELAEGDQIALDDLREFKSSLGLIAGRLGINDSDQFVTTVTGALDEGDKAKATIAEIVALFGSSEVDDLNVKAAVERLLQDAGGNNQKPADLAAAVALLDDKNDDHWTQAGQPKIAALESILGKDVSAADYAALTDAQKRTRKTA